MQTLFKASDIHESLTLKLINHDTIPWMLCDNENYIPHIGAGLARLKHYIFKCVLKHVLKRLFKKKKKKKKNHVLKHSIDTCVIILCVFVYIKHVFFINIMPWGNSSVTDGTSIPDF